MPARRQRVRHRRRQTRGFSWGSHDEVVGLAALGANLVLIDSHVEDDTDSRLLDVEVASVPAARYVIDIARVARDRIAMLIAVLFAIYSLGLKQGKKMKEVMSTLSESVTGITMILLVIAGAGALKQILVDSGVSEYIASLLEGTDLSPILVAWLIATVIRVCVGSATVAGLTAAGIALLACRRCEQPRAAQHRHGRRDQQFRTDRDRR